MSTLERIHVEHGVMWELFRFQLVFYRCALRVVWRDNTEVLVRIALHEVANSLNFPRILGTFNVSQ
jgi:hypothetical protein